MRGRIAVLAGAAAAAVAVVHKLRSRRARMAPPPVAELEPEPGPDPRADELRDRLAASRQVVDEPEQAGENETPVDEAVTPAEGEADVEQRRQEVHAQGRAAVAEMQTQPPSSPES